MEHAMLRTAIIANLQAKMNRRNPHKLAALRELADLNSNQGKLRFDCTATTSELPELIKEYKDKSIDVIGLCGGDGTISRALTEIMRVYGEDQKPTIALLGGGTVNVLLNNLKQTRNPYRNLEKLIALLSQSNKINKIEIRPLKIEDQYGFLYADGFTAGYLKTFYENKSNLAGACWLGAKIYASGVLGSKQFRNLVQHQDKSLVGTLNNQKAEQHNKSIVTFASSINAIPLGFEFFPKNIQQIHSFQAVDFTLSPQELIYKFPLILMSNKGSAPYGSKRITTNDLQISQKSSWSYTLDGELFDSKGSVVNISLGPVVEFLKY
jgi:diacylglycerol kinase family enzyme